MNKKKYTAAAILLAATLAAAPHADAAASKTASSQAVGSAAAQSPALDWRVKLGGGVTATLEQADVWQQNGDSVAVFTLQYKNGGKAAARLVTYFPKAVLPGGSVKAANPISKDLAKKKVEPGQSLTVTYYVKTDTPSLSGMKLAMDVWNPKVKGYLERVGSYRLPSNYSAAVASGVNAKLSLSGTPVTVKSESLEIIKYDGKVIARVGMSMTNNGSSAWSDRGYDPFLVTKSGSSFRLQREAGPEGTPIQPKERKLVYYITEVPTYLKPSGLRFLWTETDEALKLSLPVGSFRLPAATAPKWDVPAGAAKSLTISGQPVEARIRQATLRSSGDQGIWNIEMAFKNKGKKTAKVPAYEYAIKASEGSYHPYAPGDPGSLMLTLRPGQEKTLTLEISLPMELKQDRLKLQMIEASGDERTPSPPAGQEEPGGSTSTDAPSKASLPLAYFSIPYQTERQSSIGVEYAPQSAGGFAYTLESIQRLPWQDTDLIVAKLRLRNTHETNALQLPELKADVTADEKTVLASPEVIAGEQGSLIAPGASTEVSVLAKIPYTKDIRTLRFKLFAQQESVKTPFLTLTTPGHTQSIELLEKGKPYTVTTAGKRAEAQERRTLIYEGADSDIIYSELTLTSGEARRVQAALLKGYFQGTDGKIYEADTVQPETPIQPGGKQSVVFWARVPKGTAGSLGLALGTAMSGGKLAEPGKDVSGVLGVKKMQLNPVRPAASSNLTGLDWYPYSITVTKATGHLQEGSSSISMNVTVDVKRSDSITAADAGHKLILTIKDTLGQTQERILTPGTDIQVPGTRTLSFEMTDEQYKKLKGGWFTLTLADEFQNERITLGTQSYNVTFYPNVVEPPEE